MNKNINILTKFLLWLSTFLFVCLFGISHPKAWGIADVKWLNRSLGDFPFTTNYEPYTYNTQYFMLDGLNDGTPLPNYFIVNACATGGLTFEISNVTDGSITYQGSIDLGGTCTTGGYSGNTKRYYFKLNSYYIQNNIAYITYRVRVANTSSWTVYVTFSDYEFSDTSDFDTLRQQQQTTTDIVNSNASNTTSIINNNNSNTLSIIDNQNQNTQDMIDSQKVCSYEIIDSSSIVLPDSFLSSTAQVGASSVGFGITDYIELFDYSLLSFEHLYNETTSTYFCFYNSNKVYLSCLSNNSSGQITIPSNAKFVRFSINSNRNLPSFKLYSCKDGNQAISDDLNNLNDSLNDDDTSSATSEASDFFSSFNTNTFGLTSIISAPLNLIQSITSTSCSPLHLPLPFLDNKYLDLPCMREVYENNFGVLLTIYQTITYGIIAYWVIVRIFNQVKDFKNPEHDEIEVVDL